MKIKFKIYIILLIMLSIPFFIINKRAKHNNSSDDDNIKTSALVSLSTIKAEYSSKVIKVNGIITFNPKKNLQFNAPIELIVQQIFVHQGDLVKKGQRLLKLKLSPASSSNLLNSQENINAAKKILSQTLYLKNKFMASNSDVQNAQQTLHNAIANFNSILQAKKIMESMSVAKSTGIVTNINVQPGQLIPIYTPILTLGNDLQAQFNVAEPSSTKIKINQNVSIETANLTEVAKVTDITDQADTNGMVIVTADIPVKSEILANTAITGEISLDKPALHLMVTENAVLYDNNKPYIFVNNNGYAKKIWINVFNSNENKTYFSANATIGQKVVVLGNYELTDGMKLRTR